MADFCPAKKADTDMIVPQANSDRFLLARQPTLWLLLISQGLAGSIPPIMISLGGMVGKMISPSEALVTLPVSTFMVGTCVATIPVAMLIHRLGRVPVYVLGALVAMCGALICTYGILSGSFLLFCVGAFLFGLNIACVQSYRFAATLIVAPEHRGRAISFVLAGGLISAVVGPQIVVWTGNMSIGAPYSVSFLAQAVLALVTIPFLLFARFPAKGAPPVRTAVKPEAAPSRRSYVVSVLSGAVTYAAMSLTMTAAPLAIIACGFGVESAALGIQWHIIGMFAPSFITGRLIEKFGQFRITLAGMALIAISSVVALSGQQIGNFWIMLALLGIGWNFGFTGASVMIARAAVGPKSTVLQGGADFTIFGSVALASLSSGAIIGTLGWEVINMAVLGLLAVTACIMVIDNLQSRPAAQPAE
ncbi:MFS transporter [Falsirhodobacter sp. alg1]|uniref:MFS transporter n=1 Tax=Falsirhodobacter sp. alg1 TaxID=1472418 RepID=UPI000788A6C9|nr:MFS transporter [Falsirhodobacter sp. alg1]